MADLCADCNAPGSLFKSGPFAEADDRPVCADCYECRNPQSPPMPPVHGHVVIPDVPDHYAEQLPSLQAAYNVAMATWQQTQESRRVRLEERRRRYGYYSVIDSPSEGPIESSGAEELIPAPGEPGRAPSQTPNASKFLSKDEFLTFLRKAIRELLLPDSDRKITRDLVAEEFRTLDKKRFPQTNRDSIRTWCNKTFQVDFDAEVAGIRATLKHAENTHLSGL